MNPLIPLPVAVSVGAGDFIITDQTRITLAQDDPGVISLGKQLQDYIEQRAGPKLELATEDQGRGNIHLHLTENRAFGAEGYELMISADAVQLEANRPAGLFYGLQTMRQLLSFSPVLGLPALSIRDAPRFTWRGAMLDVARHFFRVEDVKRYLDLISHYKLNRLHLHLSDDQGWRIEIKSWPRLTTIGGKTQVNGGGGGFYTQEQYQEIVDYARSHYVMVIPEIDTPGHTNAALASYPELNCDGKAPDLYEGIEVGFSSLCIQKEITYQFLEDVIRELSALTPDPYIHIGGDEARSTSEADYRKFMKRVQQIVFAHDKIPVGWSEIGEAELDARAIAQHWSGVLGITLNRRPTMGRRGNVLWALGYSGHGVTLANLAGTVLADLYAGDDRWSDLPFVNNRLPPIPPEPFRWVGYQVYTRLTGRSPRRVD